jgi:hypothetical protein
MVRSDGDPLQVIPMKIAPESPPVGEGQAAKAVGDELKAPKANGFTEGESPFLVCQLLVFSTLVNNRMVKIARFRFRSGLTNKLAYSDLSWFSSLLGGNSPTSSRLTMKKNIVTMG